MNVILSDIQPNNNSHFLMIDNLFDNISDNINSITNRLNYSLKNLNNAFEYHKKQLDFFYQSVEHELKFINNDIFINKKTNSKINLEIIPNNNNYLINQNIKFKVNTINGITSKSNLAIELLGANQLELSEIKYNNLNNYFIYDYEIKNGNGKCNIKIYNVNKIFGNSIIENIGVQSFNIIENKENQNTQDNNAEYKKEDNNTEDKKKDTNTQDKEEDTNTQDKTEDTNTLDKEEDTII